jgi:hypothetical protein
MKALIKEITSRKCEIEKFIQIENYWMGKLF